jgi:hypothetical protein
MSNTFFDHTHFTGNIIVHSPFKSDLDGKPGHSHQDPLLLIYLLNNIISNTVLNFPDLFFFLSVIIATAINSFRSRINESMVLLRVLFHDSCLKYPGIFPLVFRRKLKAYELDSYKHYPHLR